MERSAQTSNLRIGRMNLRVPGNDAAAGHRIAQHTSELLAAGSTDLASRHIGAMRLRVQAPPGASEAEIALAVSRAILSCLTPAPDA